MIWKELLFTIYIATKCRNGNQIWMHHNYIHNSYKILILENIILSSDNYFVNFTIVDLYIAI